MWLLFFFPTPTPDFFFICVLTWVTALQIYHRRSHKSRGYPNLTFPLSLSLARVVSYFSFLLPGEIKKMPEWCWIFHFFYFFSLNFNCRRPEEERFGLEIKIFIEGRGCLIFYKAQLRFLKNFCPNFTLLYCHWNERFY